MLKWFAKRRFNWIDIGTFTAANLLWPFIGWWVLLVGVIGIAVSAEVEKAARS